MFWVLFPLLLHELDHGVISLVIIVPSSLFHPPLSEQFGSANFIRWDKFSADILPVICTSSLPRTFLSRAPMDVEQLLEERCGSPAKVGDVLLEILVLIDVVDRVAVRSQVFEELAAEDHDRVSVVALLRIKIRGIFSFLTVTSVVDATEHDVPVVPPV